ncbi:MAG: low-specificity L-threonine aldolase [Idiomarina sp.]|nr:low-specificity L-threonine aldolase [Idiomarina sp.]
MIDYRSDTVTRPTEAMRLRMASAQVGDDVFQDDPSVNAFEAKVAEQAGKAAAMICASGTQSNLCALLAHCGRGEEYLVGQEYHTYRYEAGGAAALGGIVPQTIEMEADGTFSLATMERRIKPDDPHFPVTRLVCLENTHCGKVIPSAWLHEAIKIAREYQLASHLDGARIFNAVVATQKELSELVAPFDSVSICFSKGLGCPIGSVLLGDEDFIRRARRWRKMLGGGMRQAGIVAAAMDYALDHHVERLADDHQRAQRLAQALSALSGLVVEPAVTNMVYIQFADARQAASCADFMAKHNVLIPAQGLRKRLVTHIDITDAGLARTIELFQIWSDTNKSGLSRQNG